jgi:DNA-binding FadR family transcriptional regulator
MGVGRSTIREAMRARESLGVVEIHPGQGTFLGTEEVPRIAVCRKSGRALSGRANRLFTRCRIRRRHRWRSATVS